MAQPPLDLQKRAIKIIHILREATNGMVEPAVMQIVKKYGRDPFLVLVSCLLSLRTKDTVSLPASHRLFEHAQNPKDLIALSTKKIEKIIYPVGFYRQKAQQLRGISHDIIDKFGDRVPSTEHELLSLKGVGRKTMNLVLGEGFERPAICVDTHVHRISNRLGLVKTKTPEKTEEALKELLPQKYWTEYNRLMVMWGQNVCVPVSPFVSKCAISSLCPKTGIKRSR